MPVLLLSRSGHSLCEACAKHMVAIEKTGSAFIRCPHCRAKTRWKSGKANLKVNITLQNMVERLKKAQKAAEEKKEEDQKNRSSAKARPEETVSPQLSNPANEPTILKSPERLSRETISVQQVREGSDEKTKKIDKGKEKGSLSSPFLEESPFSFDADSSFSSSYPNPEALAAFDAAIAAFTSRDEIPEVSVGAHSIQLSVNSTLHEAQEFHVPTCSPSAAEPHRKSEESGYEVKPLLDHNEEAPDPHKRKGRDRRGRVRTESSDVDDARSRLCQSCHSRPLSPTGFRREKGHRSHSQESERSRLRTRCHFF